jgi:eukaryotic-like serine/threonine-protein kinase
MEHVGGETLAARLERGPLPIDQVLRYASELADALDRAHRHGALHRDLKPANIMITRAGCKLLDFGLAKLKEADGALGATTPLSQPALDQRLPVRLCEALDLVQRSE